MKKTDFPWMYDVSRCAPQEALRDLDRAYANCFRRLELNKQGRWKGQLGFPKFKKKSKGIGSFRLTGSIPIFAESIQLPRFGRLRLYEHGYLPTKAKVLSATVSEEAGRWYVSVQVEEEQEAPAHTATSALGVDLGIKTLATLSDGTTFENPRALKHAQKRLRRLERQQARRIKGSQNRKKTVKKLARQHARVAHIRQDATHKLTSYLCNNHALVAIEDVHIAGMLKNHRLAQAVADSSFGEIRRQLTSKAQRYGTRLVVIDRFSPSSKTCSACGYVKPALGLHERTLVCEACGMVLNRDHHAALNLLQEARRTTGSSSGRDACGQSSSGRLMGDGETALDEAGTNHH